MQFPRVLSVLSLFFAFAFIFASASPVAETEVSAAKRQEADVIAILTTLHTQTLADAAAIQAAAALSPSEETITPLFDTLVAHINDATTAVTALEPSAKRQSSDDVAALVALILTDLTTTLDGLLTQLSGVPNIGVLFGGLDAALNQLLKGLEGLLAGVLNLVATLLVNVAQLLRNLALGLTLASLGL
ncbi:hypothetical protein EXIGLDRAFT_759751 [Exidia glandulosa HHB12029]|uniref:Sc15 protein n=1 Tax=Exidia glandulosa HHB12029 TaxID=1314781 RepID=A0A165PT04_EXIGL|nr:hypothetical protein EXIGLDRAFT_759751 [Exidia glandulosa HHB12029]